MLQPRDPLNHPPCDPAPHFPTPEDIELADELRHRLEERYLGACPGDPTEADEPAVVRRRLPLAARPSRERNASD